MSCHRFTSDAFRFLNIDVALDIANAHRWNEILMYEMGNDHKGVVIRKAETTDSSKVFRIFRFADLENEIPLASTIGLFEALWQARVFATE